MSDLVDLHVPLPEIWEATELSAEERDRATIDLAQMLDGAVDDPDTVAEESVAEFMGRLGGGGRPLLIASMREELDDGSVLAASLTVVRNELGGDLEPWRQAYPGADDVEVMDRPALRAHEETVVRAPDLFDEPLTLVSWRYLVPFDAGSVLMFSFSSPNGELDDLLVDHFDAIMAGVALVPSGDT